MSVAGQAATYVAVIASLSRLVVCNSRRASRLNRRALVGHVADATRQASQAALPIVAVGIIMAVAIQFKLAYEFSMHLTASTYGTLLSALGLIVVGCSVMDGIAHGRFVRSRGDPSCVGPPKARNLGDVGSFFVMILLCANDGDAAGCIGLIRCGRGLRGVGPRAPASTHSVSASSRS